MRHISRLLLLCAGGSFLLLTGCQTGHVASGSYHVTAYRPHDPSKVEVKLSTSTQNLYVMEGDRLLMAVQGNVGKAGLRPRRATSPFTVNKKSAAAEPAGCRLSDGLLVRVQTCVWIPRRLCLASPAYAWLRPAPSRGGCSALRPDQDRHAGVYRHLSSRGQGIWETSSTARSKPRPRPAAVADDVRQLVQRSSRSTAGRLIWLR